jgi:hypothetical protein
VWGVGLRVEGVECVGGGASKWTKPKPFDTFDPTSVITFASFTCFKAEASSLRV